MWDFNVKVGSESTINVTEKFGLGQRNEKGVVLPRGTFF